MVEIESVVEVVVNEEGGARVWRSQATLRQILTVHVIHLGKSIGMVRLVCTAPASELAFAATVHQIFFAHLDKYSSFLAVFGVSNALRHAGS